MAARTRYVQEYVTQASDPRRARRPWTLRHPQALLNVQLLRTEFRSNLQHGTRRRLDSGTWPCQAVMRHGEGGAPAVRRRGRVSAWRTVSQSRTCMPWLPRPDSCARNRARAIEFDSSTPSARLNGGRQPLTRRLPRLWISSPQWQPHARLTWAESYYHELRKAKANSCSRAQETTPSRHTHLPHSTHRYPIPPLRPHHMQMV